MLAELRERAGEALSSARQVVLSAGGPADVQVEILRCESMGLALYVLVARTSDLLFNLESGAPVVATADSWQARGPARLLRPAEYPSELALARAPEAAWCELVEIRPTRLLLQPPQGLRETIDLW